jgi:hypothetical protein
MTYYAENDPFWTPATSARLAYYDSRPSSVASGGSVIRVTPISQPALFWLNSVPTPFTITGPGTLTLWTVSSVDEAGCDSADVMLDGELVASLPQGDDFANGIGDPPARRATIIEVPEGDHGLQVTFTSTNKNRFYFDGADLALPSDDESPAVGPGGNRNRRSRPLPPSRNTGQPIAVSVAAEKIRRAARTLRSRSRG